MKDAVVIRQSSGKEIVRKKCTPNENHPSFTVNEVADVPRPKGKVDSVERYGIEKGVYVGKYPEPSGIGSVCSTH